MTARELPSVGRVYDQLHLQSMMLTVLLKLARSLLKLSRYLLKLARSLFNLARPVRTFARPLMNLTRIIFIYIKAKKHAMRSGIYVILCAKSVIP